MPRRGGLVNAREPGRLPLAERARMRAYHPTNPENEETAPGRGFFGVIRSALDAAGSSIGAEERTRTFTGRPAST